MGVSRLFRKYYNRMILSLQNSRDRIPVEQREIKKLTIRESQKLKINKRVSL